VRLFGHPTQIDTSISPSRFPMEVDIHRTWTFADATVEALVGGGDDVPLWVNVVEIRSPAFPLLRGIAVGMTLARLREILGDAEPGFSDDSSGTCADAGAVYFGLAAPPIPPDERYHPTASLCVIADERGIVTRIVWRQESQC
jgi:hypothetical protein